MVDFIGFYGWPSFNVADAAIVVGTVLLGLQVVVAGVSEARAFRAAAGDTGAAPRCRARCARRPEPRRGPSASSAPVSSWWTAPTARKKHVLRAGEEVVWQAPPPPEVTLAAEPVPFTVVYEDDWLLVVDKPAGVVVHPAPGHEHGTLAQGLVAEGARGGHEPARASSTASTRTPPAC